MSDRSLVWDFVVVDKGSAAVEKLGSNFGKFGKVAAVGAGTALAGVAAFGAELIKGTNEAAAYQVLSLKTAAVLKSTGNAAHTSVAGIQDLAGSLESMSGVDEMLIVNGENVLATFTNVRNEAGKGNDIFNQATVSALDMSVALGTDLSSANIQLGKALNDPVKGITALSRVGVSFTEAQKDQIAVLMKSGDVMGAQKIILKELTTEFGGAAKAAGSGFTGSWARVKDVISDTFRALGQQLLPALTRLGDWLASEGLPRVIEFSKSLGEKLAPAVTGIKTAFYDAYQILQAFITGFQNKGPIDGMSSSMTNVGKAGGYVRDAFNGLRTAGYAVYDWLANKLIPVIASATHSALPLFGGGIKAIRDGLNELIRAFRGSGGTANDFKTILSQLWSFTSKYIIPVVVFLSSVVFRALAEEFKVTAWIVSNVVLPVLGVLVRAIKIQNTEIGYAAKIIGWFIDQLVSGFKFGYNKVVGFINGIVASISRAFHNPLGMLKDAGMNILYGLRDGMFGALTGLGGWVITIGNKIVSAVKGFFGIKSPSTVFHGIGQHMLQGLINGLADHNPLDIAKKVFGSLPKALVSMFNKGMLGNIGKLGSKALSALGSALGGIFGGGGGGGSGVQRWAGVASQALALAGAPQSWLASLLRRMNQESGGNPNAINLTDSNARAGDPSRGLMQTIGATFAAYAGPFIGRGIYDPLANIYAAIKYTMARYGSGPAGWDRAGGYDSGGWLLPGTTLAYNGTGRPERVRTAEQEAALGGAVFNNYGVITTADVEDWFSKVQRDVNRKRGVR
jgi:hypothetical protein